MRKIYLITLLVLSAFCALAQGIDKPIYRIEAYRRVGSSGVDTLLGHMDVELFPLIAPKHVKNFDTLVSTQFFDSTAFHRVVPGFVIQGGDPNSRHGATSTWGYGQANQPTVDAEFSTVRHLRGRMGAARSADTNSATSQFYFCVASALHLDGNYTVYGQIVDGLDIMDLIVSAPRNSNDLPNEKISMFVTYIGVNDSVPGAPTLTQPANNTTAVLPTQQFKWTNVNDAVMYVIEYSTDSLFNTLNAVKTAGLNQTLPPTLLGSTRYYWRVKSNNGGHESIYSNVFSFVTGPSTPLLLYPANNMNSIPLNPTFTWSSSNNAIGYHLMVATTSSFSAGTIIVDLDSIADTTYQVSGLNGNSAYYWRVRAQDQYTVGAFPYRARFTTQPASGLEAIQENEHERIRAIYPVPVTDKLTLVTNPVNGAYTISIYDMQGRQLMKEEYPQADDIREHTLNVGELAKGMYLLKLKDAEGEEVKKFGIK